MPIPLETYESLEGKKLKSNKELLDWMGNTQAYTTTEVEKFLGIQHPAALQRLKRLKRMEYIELKMEKKTHYWKRLKIWPIEEDDGIIVHDITSPYISRDIERQLDKQKYEKAERRKRKTAEENTGQGS